MRRSPSRHVLSLGRMTEIRSSDVAYGSPVNFSNSSRHDRIASAARSPSLTQAARTGAGCAATANTSASWRSPQSTGRERTPSSLSTSLKHVPGERLWSTGRPFPGAALPSRSESGSASVTGGALTGGAVVDGAASGLASSPPEHAVRSKRSEIVPAHVLLMTDQYAGRRRSTWKKHWYSRVPTIGEAIAYAM